MSSSPVLDPRSREDLMEELRRRAEAYTPEWRYRPSPEDPGAALMALFGEMFYQSIDRFHSLPDKLHGAFLQLTGFQMPDPLASRGIVQFEAHPTVEGPVPVARGTQLFREDDAGEPVVYETMQPLEATPARLLDLWYVDSREDIIQCRSGEAPALLFAPEPEQNLQSHGFTLWENRALALSGGCRVELKLLEAGGYMQPETLRQLADPQHLHWSFLTQQGQEPFTAVAVEGDTLVLTYEGQAAFAPDAHGQYAITAAASHVEETVCIGSMALRSEPLTPYPLEQAVDGDVEIDLAAGGYCFGHRPGTYSLCYFRNDRVFCKAGARVLLHLDVEPVVVEPPETAIQYPYGQAIIDKKDGVLRQPDEIFVEQVVWEYYSRLGWHPLSVSGSRNPFSGRETGPLELSFQVPADICPAEVCAQEGYYIRARVVRMANEFSQYARWVLPFLRGGSCRWQYERWQPVSRCAAWNNGSETEIADGAGTTSWNLNLLVAMEPRPRAMYLRFDRSPHAMPLSLFLQLENNRALEDRLSLEAWFETGFAPLTWEDGTDRLAHSGLVRAYISKPLTPVRLFGVDGCWLRLSRSAWGAPIHGAPRLRQLWCNCAEAVQWERGTEQFFDVESYDPNPSVILPNIPIQQVNVWVDERDDITQADAEALAKQAPDGVQLLWEDHQLRHCWVRWRRCTDLALAGAESRVYTLDAYTGRIGFGDGVHGKLPPTGQEVLRIAYTYGGGTRGNCPAGTVTSLTGSLPLIRSQHNVTAMAGGTGRMTAERAGQVGSSRLRHSQRAIGMRDYEDLVLEHFPQVEHVRCFSGRDETGRRAPGHVCVVLACRDVEHQWAMDDLCRQVYGFLARRCDCVMTAQGRFHVTAATQVTISVSLLVELEDLSQTAATQQEILQRLRQIVTQVWRQRQIGDQVRPRELWQAVEQVPNVRRIHRLMGEGRYLQGAVEHMIPLEESERLPYAIAANGYHRIEIMTGN